MLSTPWLAAVDQIFSEITVRCYRDIYLKNAQLIIYVQCPY
ncbi:hypothetical protein [Piscirickettsia salmonis]|nr:hypothetical protein [Piscirickettsia salmonis]